MEHKLIQGGEQYLPFARSRISALRATGMEYGTQRYDMGDALVEVKIARDQDYITISGGACTLALDNGVVDVRSIGEYNPATFLPGVMHDSNAGKAYNAAFSLPAGGGDWLLNPSKDSSGQLAGTIKGSKSGVFKGKLPADKSTASFTPRPELSNSTVPASWVQAKRDEALWLKKITAVLCPASIFTGRTRLYVQALYGRHMYTRKGDNVTTDPLAIGLVLGSPPRITVPAYKRPDDTAGYADVAIITSTGLHLDTTTGAHWLLGITAAGIEAFPLIGDSCAESMRKFLVKPYPSGLPVLSDEALERLEAYILSRCLPDRKNMQLAECALGMSFYSMGYSWHWNYSGTKADIVTNLKYQQFPDATQPSELELYAMESSHYRVSTSLQHNPDVDGKKVPPTWSAALATIEAGTKWYINRTLWVIAEPDMNSGTLFKTTPRRSQLFASSGPFYAFYTGETLNVCRVSFTIHQPDPPTHEESDNLYHGTTPGSLGDRAGYARDKDFGSEYYKCTITCGGQSTGEMLWGHVIVAENSEFRKVLTPPLFGPRFPMDTGYKTQQYEYGYPPYELSEVIHDALINTDGYVAIGDHEVETNTVREEWVSTATVVVPPFDSEAVYLHASQNKTTVKTGNISHWTYGWFGLATQVNTYDYDAEVWNTVYFTKYVWSAFGAENGYSSGPDTPIFEDLTVPEIAIKKLVCRAGAVQLSNFDGISELHDPTTDEASGLFDVLTSASLANPVVIADKLDQPIGIDSGGDAPVFVGYV